MTRTAKMPTRRNDAVSETRVLEFRDVSARYETFDVLHEISLEVYVGEFVSIIGPNGAGKTTVLRVVSGFLHPHAGSVVMNGRSVGGWPPERIGRGLVAYVPQGRQLFAHHSVHDNLLLGGYWYRKDQGRLRSGQALVYELFPVLAANRERPVGELSGGEQQMVAIGRAIMSDARILLLDEPSLGLAPEAIEAVFTALSRLGDTGRSVLLVEQRVDLALAASNRCYVMRMGRIAYSGPSSSLQDSPEVVAAHLGEDLAVAAGVRLGA
jgi:branched-chain amino acid transport system ATP-binding protein